MLTPNRIGNFIGRLAYVKKEHHNEATVQTLIGNLAQFVSTIIMGIVGFLVVIYFYLDIQNSMLIITLSVSFSFFGLLLYFKPKKIDFYPLNKLFSDKTKQSIQQANQSPVILKVNILVLSLLRYSVFCIQYVLLFKAFGISTSILFLVGLIATVFLITTLIPSLLFGKLFVRESVAVFIFSYASIDVSLIIMVAFILWLINLAVPAILGSLFWLKQKQHA